MVRATARIGSWRLGDDFSPPPTRGRPLRTRAIRDARASPATSACLAPLHRARASLRVLTLRAAPLPHRRSPLVLLLVALPAALALLALILQVRESGAARHRAMSGVAFDPALGRRVPPAGAREKGRQQHRRASDGGDFSAYSVGAAFDPDGSGRSSAGDGSRSSKPGFALTREGLLDTAGGKGKDAADLKVMISTTTSDAQQQTDALALPFVDPNALVDPVQAAAMISEAKATSAAAHAAVRAEMESRRAFAAECTASVRAALEVNESLERQLVEAVAARRAAETAAGTRASEARRWEKALEKHRAFDALRRASEARRHSTPETDGRQPSLGSLSEVERELAFAALQCQRRRRGALGRRAARAYRDAILAEDKREWAAEERNAAVTVQSAFRARAACREAAAAAFVGRPARGSEDDFSIVASLVEGIVERVVEATDGAERTSAVKTLVRESLARVVEARGDAKPTTQ